MPKNTIKGIDKVIKELKKFGNEADELIGETTSLIADEIVLDAKARAPKDKGKLAQSIHKEKINELNYKVVVGLEYGAYIEFGTGVKISIPAELQDQASKFKGKKGSFKEGLQSIKDWCKSKGIDEKYAYPIFISILQKGITPQPFLYPAYVKGRNQYLKDLKTVLNKLVKKYG